MCYYLFISYKNFLSKSFTLCNYFNTDNTWIVNCSSLIFSYDILFYFHIKKQKSKIREEIKGKKNPHQNMMSDPASRHPRERQAPKNTGGFSRILAHDTSHCSYKSKQAWRVNILNWFKTSRQPQQGTRLMQESALPELMQKLGRKTG